jgi:molybdopterin molybdotransferase
MADPAIHHREKYMAQLTQDTFAFGGPMMTLAEAERIIRERLTPVADTEDVPLSQARGRVLARDLVSPIDLPPFDNSAVDGYAVRFGDLTQGGETRAEVADRIMAGDVGDVRISDGKAIRIFTGAPMPEGADTVFMQEDCRTEDRYVILPSGLKPGANRRKQGEDVKAGSAVLPAGCRLGPQHVAIASAVGVTRVSVRRRLRVALFSTGDEIAEPGTKLRRGQIYDANRSLLADMARALGAEVTDLGILSDNIDTLAGALSLAARDHDLVVTSGGVSTGESDFVRAAIEKIGKLVFWRVGIKPGRPVALAVLNDAGTGGQSAFAGLPGNPVAAFVTFARIVRPILLQLSGAKPEALIALPVRAAFNYRKKAGRREYVRVALKATADGALEAIKYHQDGAGVLSSITTTDGLVELTEDRTSISAGDMVGFLSYSTIIGAK